ncbi:MAG TPA: hypothetical protein ENJ55_05920 [Rhizobiales bacterium]|nr:hypothetical protein [Hyphomicrobiales bacterium]
MKVFLNRLLLVAMFSLAGYLAWDYQQRLFENKGRLVVSQSTIVPGAIEFSWRSAVEIPMARRFYEAYNKWRDKTDQFVINLHSPGGSLREGREVIKVIEQMKKSHKVITYVGPRHSCLSMCVPIFLHGDERIASPSSKWMFHEPRSVDFFTEKKINEPEFERQKMIDQYVQRYFVNSPINRDWLANLLKIWKGKDIWRSGQQLVDEGSGVISRLQ